MIPDVDSREQNCLTILASIEKGGRMTNMYTSLGPAAKNVAHIMWGKFPKNATAPQIRLAVGLIEIGTGHINQP